MLFWPSPGLDRYALVSHGKLALETVHGPAIIEEDNSTTVLNRGWLANLDEQSNIVITTG